MDSSDESGSEEEISDLLKEAANCEYVNKLYENSFSEEKVTSKHSELEKPVISSHQTYLAKVLSKKLEKLIKIDEKGKVIDQLPPKRDSDTYGIQLFSDSVLVDDVEEEVEIRHKNVPPSAPTLTDKEYRSRASEAAVSPESVLFKADTAHWKFYKPKIINMKSLKRSGEKIECVVVDKTF